MIWYSEAWDQNTVSVIIVIRVSCVQCGTDVYYKASDKLDAFYAMLNLLSRVLCCHHLVRHHAQRGCTEYD